MKRQQDSYVTCVLMVIGTVLDGGRRLKNCIHTNSGSHLYGDKACRLLSYLTKEGT